MTISEMYREYYRLHDEIACHFITDPTLSFNEIIEHYGLDKTMDRLEFLENELNKAGVWDH